MVAALIGPLGSSELLSLVAHWLSLWLGLSLLTRRPRSAASSLAGASFVVLASYLLSTALLLTPESGRADLFWGNWLGDWVAIAPPLLLHAYVRLGDTRLRHQRLLLALVYGGAAIVTVLSLWGSLIFRYRWPAGSIGPAAKGMEAIGPLYSLLVVQILGTLGGALVVLLRARRLAADSARRGLSQLNTLAAGTALMVLGSALMFGNAYYDSALPVESLLQPILLAGGFLVALGLVRYRGLLEGQLLRSDLRASLLGSALLLSGFLAIMLALGEPSERFGELGWFVLAVFVLGDQLRGLADRAVFAGGQRAGRADLRMAVSYAGSGEGLDVSSLALGQSAEVVDYLSAIDRAALASARLGGSSDQRLALLAREEFGAVRDALGLPADWRPEDGLPHEAVRRQVRHVLEPRERQALGLKYLGYSDKEMAMLMGVKPGVPRSYLGGAKRKLGIPAGASLMLFVYLAEFAESDALPLLAGCALLPAPTTESSPPGLRV